jgi:sugar phosphate isomerase/epimerase
VQDFNNVNTPDVLFGKGVCDLPAVLKELKQQQFKGVVAMEYEANENDNMKDMWKNKLYYLAETKKLTTVKQ